MTTAVLFPLSLIFLSIVVCVVYTLAVEVQTTPNQLFRSMTMRFLRLVGVLAALALVVYFLGLI